MRVDVSGLPCPQPVAVVREHLAELEAGEELVVVGDDQATRESVRRACGTHGFDVREASPPVEGGDAAFALRIRATEYSSL